MSQSWNDRFLKCTFDGHPIILPVWFSMYTKVVKSQHLALLFAASVLSHNWPLTPLSSSHNNQPKACWGLLLNGPFKRSHANMLLFSAKNYEFADVSKCQGCHSIPYKLTWLVFSLWHFKLLLMQLLDLSHWEYGLNLELRSVALAMWGVVSAWGWWLWLHYNVLTPKKKMQLTSLWYDTKKN